ncbi:putative lipase [Podospora fimiseda]|uniref:sn-1-specific diacylglycerol lipase n=1 Tax=Podospora fimiseda TaxID=252190 RepID=A0AAN6YT69_9PEZI|nr:putative lipase [Podospora fimiseda]
MIFGNHGPLIVDMNNHNALDDTQFPDHDRVITTQLREIAVSDPGNTLLPSPIAKAVSLATRSTSLALRMGTVIGGYGLDAAKFTTLSSLELGRTILGTVLSRAGKDVVSASQSELGRADAENILERSLENLHRTMSQIVFWTTTGFHVTGTTLSLFSDSSQLLLSTLDQFFGSTDSSRAMASIITLIRREFQNPATGQPGERVGVVDLMLGLCGMAYLQRWSRRSLEEESRTLRIEEVVWDVVVSSDGIRVDIHDESLYGAHNGAYSPTDSPQSTIVMTEKRPIPSSDDDDINGLPALQLERQIMRSMPDNARVSITRQIRTTEIITVEVTGGAEDVRVDTPPGVELIEENWDSQQALSRPDNVIPGSRYVFRHSRSQERRTSFQKEDGDISLVPGYVEQVDSSESPYSSNAEMEDMPPIVPPKPSKERSSRKHSFSGSGLPIAPNSSARTSRIPSGSKYGHETTANQKRPRIPPTGSPANDNTRSSESSRKQSLNRYLPSSKSKEEGGPKRSSSFRKAFSRSGSIFNRDDSSLDTTSSSKGKGKHSLSKPTIASTQRQLSTSKPSSQYSVPPRQSSVIPKWEPPAPTHRSRPGTAESRRPSSRASYISVHESRRDSSISQTEVHHIATAEDYRPVTPYEDNGPTIKKARSDRELGGGLGDSPESTHRRVKSRLYRPSIYTLRANESQTSLVPFQSYDNRSAFDDEALGTLRQAGRLEDIFPRDHFLNNITRYMRFASASYGSNFLRVLGIAKEMPILRALDDTHHELRCFAHHTESEAESILLCSFVDTQGGSDGTGSTNTGVPLVHYISLDHESKAVVLACRGTLGFEDVLADMTCDYDDLVWRGKPYKVHKGVHASAKRLLYGGDGKVLNTLKKALEKYTDYGLVLTGHSLGGAVTALLGVMLSEPAPGTSFVTSADPHTKLLGDGVNPTTPPGHICLPSGRPVHVFAYGPPSTMSSSLSKATRGLITSIVNGNDLVPYLSLGVLHDFQAVSLAFKTDNNQAKDEVRQRILKALHNGFSHQWHGSGHKPADSQQADDEQWAYAALKVLRASMMSQKLVPPGEVFVVESTRVLRRDAFLLDGEEHFGRPAQRIVLKYVRDVEKRFREVRFGISMLTDHSPGKYEDALTKLRAGVMEAPA